MSKKDKHARNQAKYMERKREAGLEWLTEWVPEPAHQAFKTIAKAARKSHAAPGEARLAEAEALAAARQDELPGWARSSEVLLAVWALSTVAETALDQVQAEREAGKSKKAEAKAAKAAAEDAPASVDAPAAEPAVKPEPQDSAPAKRARRKAAATPTETATPEAAPAAPETAAPPETAAD